MKNLIRFCQRHRKIVAFAIVAFVISSQVFAGNTFKVNNGNETYTLDLSFVKNAVNLIVGIFAGGYVLLKAALDIFHAVRNSDQDPNGLKKAIGGLVMNVAILAGFMFVINYVFGSMVTDTTTGAENGPATAQIDFFKALAGAIVQRF